MTLIKTALEEEGGKSICVPFINLILMCVPVQFTQSIKFYEEINEWTPTRQFWRTHHCIMYRGIPIQILDKKIKTISKWYCH